jgi:hypothetical protein
MNMGFKALPCKGGPVRRRKNTTIGQWSKSERRKGPTKKNRVNSIEPSTGTTGGEMPRENRQFSFSSLLSLSMSICPNPNPSHPIQIQKK